MIPGKIIRINDKVTFKLWPRLEAQDLKVTPRYSIKVKPMTVSPHYPNSHPDQLVMDMPVQQVVITIQPFPRATDVECQDDEEDSEDSLSTSSHASEESQEDEEAFLLDTDSEATAVNSDSDEVQSEWEDEDPFYTYTSLDDLTIHTQEDDDDDEPPPVVGQKRKRED